MANILNGNTIWIDATGDITDTRNISVVSITLTSSAAGGSITLKDQTTLATKLTLKVAVDEDSPMPYDYSSNPIVFPNGINISAISGVVATLIVRRQGQGAQ